MARAIASRTFGSSRTPPPPLTFMVRCVQVSPLVVWMTASSRVLAWESTSPVPTSSQSISPLAKDCGWVVWSTTWKMMDSSFGARPHQCSLRSRVTTPPSGSRLATLNGPLPGVGSSTYPVLKVSGSLYTAAGAPGCTRVIQSMYGLENTISPENSSSVWVIDSICSDPTVETTRNSSLEPLVAFHSAIRSSTTIGSPLSHLPLGLYLKRMVCGSSLTISADST